MLVEICIHCGFVHRDDRNEVRQRKAHFHFLPEDAEVAPYHATVCLACIPELARDAHATPAPSAATLWAVFFRRRKLAWGKFGIKPGSTNASLHEQDVYPSVYRALKARYRVLVQALLAEDAYE